MVELFRRFDRSGSMPSGELREILASGHNALSANEIEVLSKDLRLDASETFDYVKVSVTIMYDECWRCREVRFRPPIRWRVNGGCNHGGYLTWSDF